ncbi:SRPBCC family protein [Bradyrhizobium sp. USDA 3256]
MMAILHDSRGAPVAKAYYSTVFEQPAGEVWKIIRDFNNYPVWVHGVGTSEIEDGKSGDTVGAVRNVLYRGRRIRQRLLAQSDVERFQTYEFVDTPTLPVTDFSATVQVTPVIDGNRAFIEWWAKFDCDPPRRVELTQTLTGWFEIWLESLRDEMALRPVPAEI